MPLTIGVNLAASTPTRALVPTPAQSGGIKPAPTAVPSNGCPAKPEYRDTHPGQNILCGSAANKQFYPGPLDVVYATGKNDIIWAKNNAPNQIHGVASDTAYVNAAVDCPVQ